MIARVAEASGAPFTGKGGEHFLEAFAFDVARVRVDLIHFPILYDFYSPEREASLPVALLRLAELVGAGAAKWPVTNEPTRLSWPYGLRFTTSLRL